MRLHLDGKEVLADIRMKGTWTAVGTVTMPAFTLGDTVTINGKILDAGSGSAQIDTTGSTKGLVLQNTSDTHGCYLEFNHEHTTPEVNNIAGRIVIYGFDGAGTPARKRYAYYGAKYVNVGDGTEEAKLDWGLQVGGAENEAMTLSGAGVVSPDHSILFQSSQDSAAVANQVSLGGYDIDSTHRCLAISSEEAVATETVAADRTLRVRVNGATYKINLIAV
jgi:hypothetical protein